MCCGQRYLVVLLIFIGYLVSIGSREQFSLVITSVIPGPDGKEFNFEGKSCNASAGTIQHEAWPLNWRLYTQTVFFVGTILTQIPGGVLAIKFSAVRVSGISVIGSSALWFAMYVVLKYDIGSMVFVIRGLQGIFDGALVPAFNGLLASWVLHSEKSRMVTIAYAGAYLSPAVGCVVTGVTLCFIGTIAPLCIYGGIGVIWSVIWLASVSDSPAACSCVHTEELAHYPIENRNSNRQSIQFREVPWKKIFTSLPVIAIFVAAFCKNWVFASLITQVPAYFKDVYDYGSLKQGIWSSVPHVILTIVLIPVGFAVDYLIGKEVISTTVARKSVQTLGFGIEAGCVLALGFFNNDTVAIILLCVGVGMSGFAISGYQVNQLDLAPRYSAIITGIARIGTLGSILSTLVAAKLTESKDKTDVVQGWKNVFIIAGGIHMVGVTFYLFFASGKRQPWADLEENFAAGSVNYSSPIEGSIQPEESDELLYKDFEESIFSRSMKFERRISGEFERSSWYQSGIIG